MPHIETLEDAANAVYETQSWQFVGASREGTVYDIAVVSRGAVPLIDTAVFNDIKECVTIDSEPSESYQRMHFLRYVGDIAGLEIFVDHLTSDLDGATEGNEDPMGQFRQRHPLWPLELLIPRE